tara:strand:+ start:913 stop:1488 length:576 start_codon:yes stop_codon:yes gene_type:complete
MSAITSAPSGIGGGSMALISTQTASGSSTISFTSGIDSTYNEYVFKFYNIHPSGLNRFQFNGSSDSGSNYNVTKTTTIFVAHHDEGESDGALTYQSGDDLAQSTAFQDLMAYGNQDADDDHSLNGTLQLFSPSSTSFVKHFIATTQGNIDTNYSVNSFVAGYFNTTSAIDAIQFKMTSGTFDGVIKLYGIS